MRRAALCAIPLAACCATSATHLRGGATDLDLVTAAASSCVDSVVASPVFWPGMSVRLELTGGGEGAWLVRSLLEHALLMRGCSVRETTMGPDSTSHSLHVRVVELGVRHRGVDRRGITMIPWVLRNGACALAVRVLSPAGEVEASTRCTGERPQWTPVSELSGLSDPVFTPSLQSIPTSPGVVAPLAIAGAVGALLALFFVTSE